MDNWFIKALLLSHISNIILKVLEVDKEILVTLPLLQFDLGSYV